LKQLLFQGRNFSIVLSEYSFCLEHHLFQFRFLGQFFTLFNYVNLFVCLRIGDAYRYVVVFEIIFVNLTLLLLILLNDQFISFELVILRLSRHDLCILSENYTGIVAHFRFFL